jgi:hypothetical protein
MSMTADVLLLNADYLPLRIISWKRAMYLILDDKATAIEIYEGKVLRSPSKVWNWPAVVAMREYVKARTKLRFTRRNILARDQFTRHCTGPSPVQWRVTRTLRN